MYQVIKLYGDKEPWWFLEEWQDDIVEVVEFEDYNEALSYYEKQWQIFSDTYLNVRNKNKRMSSFWDAEDVHWCEECEDFLQWYHSLLLLKDWQVDF